MVNTNLISTDGELDVFDGCVASLDISKCNSRSGDSIAEVQGIRFSVTAALVNSPRI